MKIVPPIPPFPNVYTRARRGRSATGDKSKAQVLPEILEAHIQQKLQKEYQPTPLDEELLKDVRYDISSKKKKEEAKPVAGTRKRHNRDNNKFRLKSKDLHNPSLMTEVIDIEGKPKGSKTKKSMKKKKNKAPSKQHSEPSKRRKTKKGSKEEKATIKEIATRVTILKLAADRKKDQDNLAEVAAHIEGR